MWIGSPLSVRVMSFLMKSVLLSRRMLSSVFSVSPSDDLSDGRGTDSAIGFGGGDDSRRKVCAEDLGWDIGSVESPKGFPHTITWVSVEFSHPRPMLVPSTTRSRGSVGGREFDGEQELAEEALACLLR